MKKYIALIAFMFILASCATQPVKEGAPKSENVMEKQEPPIMQQKAIDSDVKELLSKSKARVSNVYYHYRGPETGSNFHEFYIKGSKIKIKPYLEIKTLDKPESYDSVFIDKAAGTAVSYCEAAYCAYKGKKKDLNYGQAYIPTIFDWIEVTQAAKAGEEVIDSRSTWKLETNLGTLWVDTFYGIPLKAESNGKTYRFEQINANGVQDSDVVPSS